MSDVTRLEVPVSGHYFLHLGCDVINQTGLVWLRCNTRERLLIPGRSDIIELDQAEWPTLIGRGLLDCALIG